MYICFCKLFDYSFNSKKLLYLYLLYLCINPNLITNVNEQYLK